MMNEEQINTSDAELSETLHKSLNVRTDKALKLSLTEARGIPLQEIDQEITGTYCMIARKFGKDYIYRFNEEKSLYIFSPTNCVRRIVCCIATHIIFDIFIMITIICNCILLAFESGDAFHYASYFDKIFLVIYVFEMIIYLIARGFIIGNYTYLRSSWRCLDFIIVIMGILTVILNISDNNNKFVDEMKSLKAFVILKIITTIPDLRLIINGMFRSLRAMTDIALLTVILIVTTSLIGKELFMGVLFQKCVSDKITFTKYDLQNESNWLIDKNGLPISCGNGTGARKCPHGYVCLKDIGINDSEYEPNFDTFFSSVFCTFSIITLDDWQDLFEKLFYTAGLISVPFFALLIIFGAFFLLNIMLAIVAESYQIALNEEWEVSETKTNLQYFRESELFHFRIEDLELVKYAKYPIKEMTDRQQEHIVNIKDDMFETNVLQEQINSQKSKSVKFKDESSQPSSQLSCLQLLKLKVYYFIHNPVTQTIRFIIMLLGTVILACEHHGISNKFQDILTHCNQVLTVIAIIDLCLMIFTYGSCFFSDGWRVFDGIIVAFSNIHLFLSSFIKLITVKSLRLIRLMRLTRFSILKKTVTVIGNTLISLTGLSFVLFIIVYIFAVIGTRLFRKEFDYHKRYYIDRWTFIDFFHSLLAVFKILLGEWTDSIFDCIKIMPDNQIICSMLMMSCFLLGNFVIFNLFMAVLLGEFQVDTFEDIQDEEIENTRKTIEYINKKLRYLLFWKKDNNPSKEVIGNENSKITSKIENQEEQKRDWCSCCPYFLRNFWNVCHSKTELLINSIYFEILVIVVIIIGTFPLCFSYLSLDPDSKLRYLFDILNACFTVFLILEIILRLFALDKFSLDGIMILDLFIIMICIIGIFKNSIFGIQLMTVRVFRLLRILKSLKHIIQLPQMQITIEAVLLSSKSVFKVLLLCLYIWLIFAIIGVQLFAGRLQYCIDEDDTKLLNDEVKTKLDCVVKNYTWIRPKLNFDHIGNSYLILLRVTYFEDWKEIIESGVDSNGIDRQPSFEANLFAYVFFFLFIIFGSLFPINLLVGIVVDSFNAMKKETEIKVIADLEASKHYDIYKNFMKILNKKPLKHLKDTKDPSKSLIYQLFTGFWSDFIVSSVVILQIIILSLQNYNQPKSMIALHQIFEYIFVIIYSFEAMIKLILFKIDFFTYLVNCLDLFLLCLSYVSLIVRQGFGFFNFPRLTTISIFRIVHFIMMLEQMRVSDSMQRLISTIIRSIPYLFSISVIWVTVLIIYSIIGISLFRDVQGLTFNEYFNFNTLSSAILILFSLLTASGWTKILDNLSVEPPECDIHYKNLPYGNCGRYELAIIYILSYILITHIILVNLFIAVILDNYNEFTYSEEIADQIDLDDFYKKWAKYDPRCTHFIPLESLSNFLKTIIDPSLLNSDMAFNLPIYDGNKIHCINVLIELMKHKTRPNEEAVLVIDNVYKKLKKHFEKNFKTLKKFPVINTTNDIKEEVKSHSEDPEDPKLQKV